MREFCKSNLLGLLLNESGYAFKKMIFRRVKASVLCAWKGINYFFFFAETFGGLIFGN